MNIQLSFNKITCLSIIKSIVLKFSFFVLFSQALSAQVSDSIYLFYIDTLGLKSTTNSLNVWGDYPIAVEINGQFATIVKPDRHKRSVRLVSCTFPVIINVRVLDVTRKGYRNRRKNIYNWYDSELKVNPEALGTNRIWLKPEWDGDSLVVRPRPLPTHRINAMRRIRNSITEWEYNCQTGNARRLNSKGETKNTYKLSSTLEEIFPKTFKY